MTRRAGLIESPTSTIGPPSLTGGAHPAVAQAYDDLAKASRSLGDILQPAVDNATEERARKAVIEGNFKRTGGITRQDELYNKVVDAGVIAQGSIDVDKAVTDLETSHLTDLDVGKFTEENAAAREAYLSNMDSRHAIPLGQEWDRRALAGTQRLSATAMQKAESRAIESLKARQSLLTDQISGASDPNDPDIAVKLEELQSILTARSFYPGDNFTPDEGRAIYDGALSRMSANRIGDEAVAYYVENGLTEAAYNESLKQLDDAMASPELSLPRTERSSLLGAARTSLNAARSEHKREQAELDRMIREAEQRAATAFGVDYGEANLRASEGHAPDEAEIADLYKLAVQTGDAAPRYIAKVDRLARTASVQQQMRGLSVPQQEAVVQSLEMEAANGSAEAALMLDSAKKVASASGAAARSDPATFAALSEKRDVPVIDWRTPEATVETMTGRFTEAEVAAGDLGVEVRYFSPADRNQLKAIAEKGGTPALTAAATIVTAAEDAGIDPLRPLSEISSAGQAPLLATAGALIAQGAPQDTAAMIMAGVEVMKTELVKDKMPSQVTQASAQKRVLGQQMGRMAPEAIDSLTRAADAHFAATVIATGGSAASGDYEKSLRAVMGEWTDEKGQKFGGQTSLDVGFMSSEKTFVPAWMQQSQFMTAVRTLTAAETAMMYRGNRGSGGFVGTRPATLQDYRAAYPVHAGPGLYYFATEAPRNGVGGRFITNANGEPVIMDFNTARDALRQRLPDAVR